MISPSASRDHLHTALLGDIVDFLDHLRRPVTESDRRPGPYPYYGANGIQGYIDTSMSTFSMNHCFFWRKTAVISTPPVEG
jgi:hypothetical protein